MKKNNFIPITTAYTDTNDAKCVKKSIIKEWGNNCNDSLNKFEKNFKNYFKINFCSATSSCTGALHLALKTLDIKKGDEVILPDITWISCAAAITYVGAKPIFADVKKDTWCLDPDSIKKKINKKTKAILAVHLYGNICDLDSIKIICKKNNIFLIEDCAEAIGGKYNNKYVGTFGDISVFSFHGTKMITTGEGGMICFKLPSLFNKYKKIHNMGIDNSKYQYFYSSIIGLKYKMNNFTAALGLSQLKKLRNNIKKKKQIFEIYKKYLDPRYIKMNTEERNSKSVYWMTTITINSKKRLKEKLINYLRSKKILARPFFYPISSMPMFKNSMNKNSYFLSRNSINLPSGISLKERDIIKITNCVNEYCKKNI